MGYSKKNKEGRAVISESETVELEVCIDEFSDDDLVAEVKRRSLEVLCMASGTATEDPQPSLSLKELAGDVYNHLVTNRNEKAVATLESLIELFVPPEVLASYRAAKAGRYSEALCEIDRFIEPSPAATHKPELRA